MKTEQMFVELSSVLKIFYAESCFTKNANFQYVVWAIKDDFESPHTPLAHGFLPSPTGGKTHYYLCRSIRIPLYREILSKDGKRTRNRFWDRTTLDLIPISQFQPQDVHFERMINKYEHIGLAPPSYLVERKTLKHHYFSSHVLDVACSATNKSIAHAIISIDPHERSALYRMGFVDTSGSSITQTQLIQLLAISLKKTGLRFLYLGTCYGSESEYKTRFSSIEFFTGFDWSDAKFNLQNLLKLDSQRPCSHNCAEQSVESTLLGYNSNSSSGTDV